MVIPDLRSLFIIIFVRLPVVWQGLRPPHISMESLSGERRTLVITGIDSFSDPAELTQPAALRAAHISRSPLAGRLIANGDRVWCNSDRRYDRVASTQFRPISVSLPFSVPITAVHCSMLQSNVDYRGVTTGVGPE